MEWEAQDEGFLAKIIVQDGAQDIKVGTLVAIMVEDKDSVRHAAAAAAAAGSSIFEENAACMRRAFSGALVLTAKQQCRPGWPALAHTSSRLLYALMPGAAAQRLHACRTCGLLHL